MSEFAFISVEVKLEPIYMIICRNYKTQVLIYKKVAFLVKVWCTVQTQIPHTHTHKLSLLLLPMHGPVLIESSSVSYFSRPFPPLPAGCCFAIIVLTWFTPDNISPCKASRYRSRPSTRLLC